MIDPNTSKIRKDVDDIQGTGFVSATHGLAAQGLKGVQRGLVTLSAGTANVAITAVDLSKTFLTFNFLTDDASDNRASTVKGYLSTTTNIAFSRGASTGNVDIAWEVIEWR